MTVITLIILKGPADLVAKNLDALAKKYDSEKIIIFCNGSLQYEIPFFLNQGLENLKNSEVRFFYCMAEAYELKFTNVDSYHRKYTLDTQLSKIYFKK